MRPPLASVHADSLDRALVFLAAVERIADHVSIAIIGNYGDASRGRDECDRRLRQDVRGLGAGCEEGDGDGDDVEAHVGDALGREL